jgi:DNA end-binding protein Ku
MAARAIWKGVVRIGTARVPVKLYSAVTDRTVHFRLLHKTDKQPVKQMLISSENEETVQYEEVRKAYPLTRGRMVAFDEGELEKLKPKESRDIEITRFVNPDEIDPRFYDRAYYLGPDGDAKEYFAAAEALAKKKKEGIARWVMRDRAYVGALKEEDGYLMLITMRHADEIIDAEALKPPAGRPLEKREIEMAEQLLGALHGEFDPSEYRDEYRARVMELIEAKSKGRKPKVEKFRPRRVKKEEELDNILAASLAKVRKAS